MCDVVCVHHSNIISIHKTFSYLKAPEKRSIASVCKSWKVLVKESYKKEKWDFLHKVNHIESELCLNLTLT